MLPMEASQKASNTQEDQRKAEPPVKARNEA